MTNSIKPKLNKWLSRIDREKHLAVVMGGSVNGLSFARSLGRRGVPVLILDSDWGIGMYTRYANTQIIPSTFTHEDEWVAFHDHIGSQLERPGVIFPTSDEHALFIARNASSLERYFRFFGPTLEILESIIDKKKQYLTAKEAGIPIPQTFFPESDDNITEIAERMSYPCILKSYKSFLRHKKHKGKVIIASSADDLIQRYRQISSDEIKFMIQEIIPGEDNMLYGYLSLWDSGSNEYAWVTKQKLRQNPPYYGDGSLQITVDAPEVRNLSIQLLNAFNYTGFSGIEYKHDQRDGTYRLMEINPRTVSGNQIAISAGVDFPWIGYLVLTEGGKADSSNSRHSFQPGVKYINEEWDFKAFRAFRRSGQLTFGAWLKSIKGARAKAIFAFDDQYPFWVVCFRFIRAFIRGIVKK